MTEALSKTVPPSASLVEIPDVVSDLDRIIALPKRAPLNTERDRKTRRYVAPETQALVEVVTEKYARPSRISCACRPRRIVRGEGAELIVGRLLPEMMPPEPPIRTTVSAFVQDQLNPAVGKAIGILRPGEALEFPSADGSLLGHPCIKELNAVQAWTLWEAEKYGVLGWLGVGSGKTIAGLLAPLAFSDCRLAVLLIEPSQRQHYKAHYLRLREHFRVGSIVHEDVNGSHTVPGTPPLHIVPYSKLSQTHSTDLLDRLNPDVIIADEAHRIAGESARTRRILRYVRKRIAEREEMMRQGLPVRRRAVYFLPWSGTLEDKSIRDTQHLAAFALGTGSPVPIDPAEADRWSQVIDPVKQPDVTSQTARSLQRVFGGGEVDTTSVAARLFSKPEEAIRKGYKERRLWTPGVVSASAASIGASIYFKERKAPPIPKVVAEALARVRQDALRPDGDLIVEPSMQVQIAKEIAGGFSYYWAFPKIKCSCPPLKFPPCEGCALIAKWYSCRKVYGRDLRALLLRGLAHLDSPKLCRHAAERALELGDGDSGRVYCGTCDVDWPCSHKSHLPAWGIPSWTPWAEIKDKVPHEQRVRWLGHELPEAKDPKTHPGYFLARDAAEWAHEHKGIIWVLSVALGKKIAELADIPYHGGGPESEALIRAETGKRSIVCSIAAHGSGRDGLQEHFWEQLFAEMPAGSKRMEQALGRTHRELQKADSIWTEAYLHVHELQEALRKAHAGAEFIYQMTGQAGKLLMCDFDLQSMEI